MFYHISNNPKLKALKPKIPETAVSTFEDVTIPRICFSTSIDGCLSSVDQGEGTYYVYTPTNDINIHIPTVDEVRDAKYTGEVWVLNKTSVKLIGTIKAHDYISSKTHNSGRGRVGIRFYPYDWINKIQSN